MNIDTSLSHILLNEQENLSFRSQVPLEETTTNTQPPSVQPAHAIEHIYRTDPRDVVEFQGIEIDLEDYETSDEPIDGIDVRHMSPREMVNLSLDLYIEGSLSFAEYSLLAFQPELHPDFEDTIGALTGEKSDPDEPRDFIQEWQDRQSFERRYPSDNGRILKQINHVLDVLSQLTPPVDFSA